MSNQIFAIKKDGKVKYWKLGREKVNFPPYGILTEAELLAKPEALRALASGNAPSRIFIEVNEAEFNAQNEREEKLAKEQAEKVAADKAEAEKVAYEQAKEIVEAYEQANKPAPKAPKKSTSKKD